MRKDTDTAIILVQHGDFPFDFIERQRQMFDFIEEMLEKLSDESRALPRKEANDYNGQDIARLAEAVRAAGGFRHFAVGFMEFAPPTVAEATRKLVDAGGLRKVVFVNAPGLAMRSSHSLLDVPELLREIAAERPEVEVIYALPGVDLAAMADMLVKKIDLALGLPGFASDNVAVLQPCEEVDGIGVVMVAHGDIPLEYLKGKKNIMGNAEGHIEAWSQMVCAWPRCEENDPLSYDTEKLAVLIRQKAGYPLFFVGNLEFARPTLAEVLDEALAGGAKKVLFVGGTGFLDRSSHTFIDVPEAIERLRAAHPGVDMAYAYPEIEPLCADLGYMIARKALEAMKTGGMPLKS